MFSHVNFQTLITPAIYSQIVWTAPIKKKKNQQTTLAIYGKAEDSLIFLQLIMQFSRVPYFSSLLP